MFVRPVNGSLHDRLKVLYHPDNGGGIKQVGVVKHSPIQRLIRFDQLHLQIEPGESLFEWKRLNLQPAQLLSSSALVQRKNLREIFQPVKLLQLKHDVEERRTVGLTKHLKFIDEQRKRIILMLQP